MPPIGSIWSRDLPLGRCALAGGGHGAERPFDLVGVHWRGSGRVELRTRQWVRRVEPVAGGRARGGGPP